LGIPALGQEDEHVTRKTEREVESALIAVSDDAPKVLAQVEALREIDDYVLGRRAPENIVDEYLDTRDVRLGAHRIALRIRSLDGAPRLTLKGPTESRKGPTSSRLEIERSWSTSAASLALRALADLDVPLGRRTASRAWKTPEDFAKALGLSRVQRRETNRTPRDVRRRTGTGRPLAELSIDRVTYAVGRRKVRVAEIEVEAKRPDGIVAADRVTEWLGAHVKALRPWSHSKLATGLALDALEGEGRMAELVSSGGWLTARGIDAVSRWLQRTARKGAG